MADEPLQKEEETQEKEEEVEEHDQIVEDINIEYVVARFKELEEEASLKLIAKALGLNNIETDLRERILCEFHFYNIHFSFFEGFSQQKVLSIAKMSQNIIENSYSQGSGWISMDESYEKFKQDLINHTNTSLFTLDDIRAITKHFTSTFFQNYALYRFVVTKDQDSLQSTLSLLVETPLNIIPLSQFTELTLEEISIDKAERLNIEKQTIRTHTDIERGNFSDIYSLSFPSLDEIPNEEREGIEAQLRSLHQDLEAELSSMISSQEEHLECLRKQIQELQEATSF